METLSYVVGSGKGTCHTLNQPFSPEETAPMLASWLLLKLRMPAGLDYSPVARLLFILESTVGESFKETRGF